MDQTTVSISGLPLDTTHEDMLSQFLCYGKIEVIYLPHNLATGKCLGVAGITFADRQAAINACSFIHFIRGSQVRIAFHGGSASSSARPRGSLNQGVQRPPSVPCEGQQMIGNSYANMASLPFYSWPIPAPPMQHGLIQLPWPTQQQQPSSILGPPPMTNGPAHMPNASAPTVLTGHVQSGGLLYPSLQLPQHHLQQGQPAHWQSFIRDNQGTQNDSYCRGIGQSTSPLANVSLPPPFISMAPTSTGHPASSVSYSPPYRAKKFLGRHRRHPEGGRHGAY